MNTPAVQRKRDILWIKRLIWSYFFLLILEGALRKWVLPSQANILLVIRDPIVMAAYFLAWRSGTFPRNTFISSITFIGIISFAVGMFVINESPAIALFGFRANFLHWPFVFLIAKIFDLRDVNRVGYWTLVLAIPMALLMMAQYLAPSSSFLNAGAGEDSGQIIAALGHIRPAGTFSFISGPVYFYSFVVAILLYSQFSPRYPSWLVALATVATLCAMAVSGSRSLVACIAVVFAFGLLCSSILKPPMAFRWLGSLIVIIIMGNLLTNIPIIKMGVESFSERVTRASNSEGGSEGFVDRAFSGYTDFVPKLYEEPLLGRGLGVATNAGAALMKDRSKAVWFEDEWARHISESGPFLGGALILYRILLTAWIGFIALRHMVRFDPFSALLFGSCFLILLTGSIGQPTTQGFVMLVSGLCLAATRLSKTRPETSADFDAVSTTATPTTATSPAEQEPALSI